MFIEAPMHLFFLVIGKRITEVSDKYVKQNRLGNKFISHANICIAQLEPFWLDFLKILQFPKTNYLEEWCLGMAHVFPFIYGKSTASIEFKIHYGNNYMCIVHSMYAMVAHLMSQQKTSSWQQLQHIKLFLDCCHQFCKATHNETITLFWLPKGNYVTLLNLPEQVEQFGPFQDYKEGTWEWYIHWIKNQLLKMHRAQTYLSSKLPEVHQTNVLDYIMENLDPSEQSTTISKNYLFHVCQ